jgi:hypothetical protein
MTDQTPRALPRWGRVAGLGRVRILSYEGSGRWMVLDSKDTRRLVDKSRLTFTKR